MSPDINYQSEDTLLWDQSERPSQLSSEQSSITNESSSQDFAPYSGQASQVSTASAKAAAKKQKQNQRLALLGVLGISAVAFVGGIDYLRTKQNPSVPQQIVQQPSSSIESAPTEALTARASEQLTQGKIKQGLKAVEELLNRGALSNAETALENVDKEQINNPYVNFVKGRLAWQFIQKGDTKYSIDDARRYWEVATQNDPNSYLYKNALGFAYYAEGEIDRANDSWLQALDLSSNKKAAQNVSNSLMSVSPVANKEALGLYQSSHEQPSEKKVKYISEAIKLRRKVMKDDSKSFQENSLAKNWLWTEKAITDWQSLVKLDSSS